MNHISLVINIKAPPMTVVLIQLKLLSRVAIFSFLSAHLGNPTPLDTLSNVS